MNRLVVLCEGHARKEGRDWIASPATCLIDTGNSRIIVDPGNRRDIEDLLLDRSLEPGDVDRVFITHHHPDHTLNVGLFASAGLIDNTFIYQGERMTPHDGRIPGTDIMIVPTPGHTMDHASLIVPGSDEITMICGDLFWWTEGNEPPLKRKALISLEDEFAEDHNILRSSRASALDSEATFFIPGHGGAFRL